MKDLKPTCRIAVVQAAPVLFDKTACTDKAVHLIAECARSGAELIVFPELFIPGYPYGMTFGFTVGARNEDGRKDWQLYCDNSIVVPGPETERLAAAAKAAGAYVSIGVSERDGVTGTLYNANLIFCPDGSTSRRAPQAQAHRRGARGLGRRRPRVFPGRGHAVGTDGQSHLLGELYAAGTHGAV